MRLDIDSDLGCEVVTGGARPLISTPLINFGKLADRGISDAF